VGDRISIRLKDFMSPAARSVNVFGIYLLLLGVVLLAAPNLLLGLFHLPPTTEVWLRVAGMLRASVPLFFLAFVLAGWAEWPLLVFAGLDAAGAAWTWRALHFTGAAA
jgi:hypothetical protein